MENEQKQGSVKPAETRLPKFVEDAYESVEKMEKFATILLNSRLVPYHFYEKLPDGKPDFAKGKTPAVVAVLIQGYQLQLPPLTALQHIIPVNGLLSIKGDLAKSMIFNSGKLKSGSWVEEETGSIDEGNLIVKITATRADNGQTLSRSFSVAQAKRAGLWITEQQVNGQDGWKYKSSAWWKFPSRMINYRALGFLARDMFPDVMAGIYTTEEAMDLPKDVTEIIETESGATITIPDKEHAQKRAGRLTERVADKIPDNKFGEVKKDNIQEAQIVEPEKKIESEKQMPEVNTGLIANVLNAVSGVESPFIPGRGSVEYMDGKEIKRDEPPLKEGQLTLKQMEEMDTKVLLDMVNADMEMMEAAGIMPGKNTNRKLREIIFAHQNGRLANLIEPFKMHPAEENAGEGLFPNKDFDNQQTNHSVPEPIKEPEPVAEPGNKYNLEVLPFDKGQEREFSTYKQLFNKFMFITPQITTPRYMELSEKLGFDKKYPNKETFLKYATVDEINLLLNTN